MQLYWRETRRGLDLVVLQDNGEEFDVGGVRETKRGIEAIAKTTGYDPGRATKGLSSIEEGKEFVESFRPWEVFFAEQLEVEPKVRPADGA